MKPAGIGGYGCAKRVLALRDINALAKSDDDSEEAIRL